MNNELLEITQTEENVENQTSLTKIIGIIIGVISVIGVLFHVFIGYKTSISVFHQRIIHVFLILLIFYLYQIEDKIKNRKWTVWLYGLFAIAAIIIGTYFVLNTTVEKLINHGIQGVSSLDIVMGVFLIVGVFDITRRKVGWALAIIGLVFVSYALFGRYMPNIIKHKGYDIPYITNYLTWTTEGIFGTAIGASVSFVVLYIILGELLDVFGAGKFFIDIAYAITGRMKGGPAEASVVSSALMGSINGSAVANVVTTGTFTIPLMKKVGYSPKYAGAVEAVASTGGQILPPVMGAAAFVMADMTGIPYSQILIAALVPGLLYYLALGICVFLEADKLGLKAEPKDRLPNVIKVLKEGWYFLIPIVILIYCLLVLEYSANFSCIFAIASLLVVGLAKTIIKEKRIPFKELYIACRKSMKTSIAVATACACAGIVIGIVSMTGIGVKFTSIVFELANGKVFLMLLMIMLACIVLGMGLPSTAAYVIAATVGAPALVLAGIPLLAAHLFVFYFAIISFITPPVALAAYAAAGLSGSKVGETGVQAFILGLSGFIIPFIYVYNPALLIVGSDLGSIIYIILLSVFAVALLSISVSGWLKGKLHPIMRILFFVAAILIFIQGFKITDYLGIALGIVLIVVALYLNTRKQRLHVKTE